ncbi:adenosine receptor A1-like [Paramuricea clavata]|nr:adenosine receptor A1-like [Paramuricea clavata]
MPALAGQSTSSPSIMKTVSSNASNASNETTSSSKLWFELTEEDKMKVRIATMSVAAVGILLNLVVIIAIVIDPLKILRKGPWITILNLATADLISCISAFCLWGETFFNKTQNDLYSATVTFGWTFGVSASFLLLTFFAVQIFLLTKFPLKSRYCLTTQRIALVCILLWLFACLLGFSCIVVWLDKPKLDYLKISAAQIGVLQIALVVQIVLNIQVAFEIIRSGRSAGNPENAKHKNIAKTVIILTLILFFTAFPYFIVQQIDFLVRLGYLGQGKTAKALFSLSRCYVPIAILNFGANPILYALRLPDYRQTLLAFVGKKEVRSRSSSLRSQRTSVTKSHTKEMKEQLM